MHTNDKHTQAQAHTDLNTAHVEAVDVVPEVDLVLAVLCILDGAHIHGGLIGEQQAAGHLNL
jgi:hypothetical protein